MTEHGWWERYMPDPAPRGMPPGLMYCRRTTDKRDYHEFRRSLRPDTVKMTVMENPPGRLTVMAVNRDPVFVFPQDCLLIEVEGIDSDDNVHLQSNWGGREYLPDSKTFGS